MPIVKSLLDEGASIGLHDPEATETFKALLETEGINYEGADNKIKFAGSAAGALEGADAAIVQVGWKEYLELEPDDFSVMRQKIIIDGRRVLDANALIEAGIKYYGIGWAKSC